MVRVLVVDLEFIIGVAGEIMISNLKELKVMKPFVCMKFHIASPGDLTQLSLLDFGPVKNF
jgi:hypothetical protein